MFILNLSSKPSSSWPSVALKAETMLQSWQEMLRKYFHKANPIRLFRRRRPKLVQYRDLIHVTRAKLVENEKEADFASIVVLNRVRSFR